MPPRAPENPLVKSLRVTSNVYKRAMKDLTHYEKEHVQQSQKIAKLRDDNADEHDIRKQQEVLEETEAMIPDCKSRIRKAREDLKEFLDKHQDDEALKNQELLTEALALVADK